MVESVEAVQAFLDETIEIIETNGRCKVNDEKWVRKANKTQIYMAETGIRIRDIKNIIKELTIENYSATKDDANPNFPKERVWEFGITKSVVDKEEKLYIKLKIRRLKEKSLLIMSFHPEKPPNPEDRLQFPYKNN